ncbi:MAG: class I SAM-dependent methyltransferase [Alphaproteobacteria bacterium]|nr:class I SAM-dependent methyltransferase [Alphaproteobacteria bacterium]
MTQESAAKFDMSRAAEYGRQSRIGLAGYDACHELSACMLSAALGEDQQARVLVVGAGGTGGEIIASSRLEPKWSFVAVDPSPPMLDLARANFVEVGVSDRVDTILGTVPDIDSFLRFDAAIMIGVLHHLPGDAEKQDILAQISKRLKPEAPFVVAGNYRSYTSQPLLLQAWANRWRMHGTDPDDCKAKMGKILKDAEPPDSEEAVISLLTCAGFGEPVRYFSSLFWGAWLARRISKVDNRF